MPAQDHPAYRYTAEDQLAAAPYHYMYTPFEGPGLFDGYFHDRAVLIARLKEMTAPPAKDGASACFADWPGLDTAVTLDQVEGKARGDEDETTLETLERIVREQVLARHTVDPHALAFIRELVRKFEVSKRLRLRYDTSMKAPDKSSAPLAAYALLAFLLSITIAGKDQNRFLNALLKLVDLVASADLQQLSLVSAQALTLAAEREIELVRGLMTRHGLDTAQGGSVA